MFRTSMGRAAALAVATALLFSACSDAGLLASASISGVSFGAPISSRTAASLSRLRPAIAQFRPLSAL